MRWFSKSEVLGVFLILLAVASITAYNLNISVRRSRDVQRRGDLGAVSNAVEKFYSEYGFFPPAEGGRIKFCKGSNFEAVFAQVQEKDTFDRELFFQGLRPCEWGWDALTDVLNDGSEYMKSLPSDPKTKEGLSYYYLSNTKRYQIYSYLEGGESENGYSSNIVIRALPCGKGVCSFGKSYADTPLDISIEDYEAKLLEEQRL